MKKIVKNVILKYLIRNKLINQSQHGFLARLSTVSQLPECTNDWTINMAKQTVTDCLYVDFKQTFYVISHHKLLTILIAYGIDGLLLEWMRSFMSNRLQFVYINSILSKPCTVVVLQVVFLKQCLYGTLNVPVCDIATGSVFTKLFADDLKICTEVNITCSSSDLQACLSRLQVWAAKGQMDNAVDKCYTNTVILRCSFHRVSSCQV